MSGLRLNKVTSFIGRKISLIYHNKLFLRFLPAPSIESIVADWVEVYNKGAGKKVLYLGVKYDYGDPGKGISYEEYNFFHTLKNTKDIEIIRIDIYSIYFRYGKEIANKVIKELVLVEGVDKVLLLLYLDIFDHDMLRDLSDNHSIEMILWLFDDDKRHKETEHLVTCFNSVVTTVKIRHQERLEIGINSKLAQFAANHFLYRDYGLKRDIDVVFIGQNFGNREEYIELLEKNGISVSAFGRGWKNSQRLTQVEMIETLNRAKIALNFSASQGNPNLKFIKGRIFEIPATGAMLITENCENLEDYFEIGKHLESFDNSRQLLDKLKYYLHECKAREGIAENGKELVISSHTFEHYLRYVILDENMGL